MRLAALVLSGLLLFACKPKTVGSAEAKKDVPWLAEQGTPDAVAALGRLADTDARALSALDARAPTDINVYIAAWEAVIRNAPWGSSFLRSALGDPTRAELAATALPRRDARLIPFTSDIEGAVQRLAAGSRGAVLAGILASIGPQAHAAVQRRLMDPKTRGAMCDGIALPEASGDAKSLLLAVPPEGRDHASCVTTLLTMAATEDVVIDWLATGAESGLLTATAKSSLACPRVAVIWKKALSDRPAETHAALSVPLQRSLTRCSTALDPVLAELLTKAPRARAAIIQAIDPFSNDLVDLKETCNALRAGHANGEHPRIRERARDALAHGCAFTR